MYERLRLIDGKQMQFSKCSKQYTCTSTVYFIVIYEKVLVSQLLSCNPLDKLWLLLFAHLIAPINVINICCKKKKKKKSPLNQRLLDCPHKKNKSIHCLKLPMFMCTWQGPLAAVWTDGLLWSRLGWMVGPAEMQLLLHVGLDLTMAWTWIWIYVLYLIKP